MTQKCIECGDDLNEDEHDLCHSCVHVDAQLQWADDNFKSRREERL